MYNYLSEYYSLVFLFLLIKEDCFKKLVIVKMLNVIATTFNTEEVYIDNKLQNSTKKINFLAKV